MPKGGLPKSHVFLLVTICYYDQFDFVNATLEEWQLGCDGNLNLLTTTRQGPGGLVIHT